MLVLEIVGVFFIIGIELWEILTLENNIKKKEVMLKKIYERSMLKDRINTSEYMIDEIDRMINSEVLIRDYNYLKFGMGWRKKNYIITDIESDIGAISEAVISFIQPSAINHRALIHTKSFYEHYIRCSTRKHVIEKVKKLRPELFNK